MKISVDITHNEEKNMFHTFVEGRESFIRYRKRGPVMLEYYETYVPPVLRQHGIASQLAEFALNHARKNNYQVIATCSFIKAYIDQHHEFENMTVKNIDPLN